MEMKKAKGTSINDSEEKGLNAYSLTGIGIGGIVGAGFFLGSSLAIYQAGPSVTAAFLLGGLIMSQVLGAMTSISINRPIRGSFRVYTEEFLGPFVGYVLGWVVFLSGILAVSSEAIASGIFLRYWFKNVPMALLALAVLLIVIGVNRVGTRGISYVESGMAVVKIAILVVFIIFGITYLSTKGVSVTPKPFSSYQAFFPKGISGLFESMLVVIFTYSGVSAVAMATSEVKNPHRDIPRATLLTTLGIVILYVASMVTIVSIIPWNAMNTNESPFVQAFQKMGVGYMSTLMNAIILLATFSVMIASYFACMQMIASLSESHKAPRFLSTAAGKGFLRNAWIVVAVSSLVFVAISFMLGSKTFNYLVSASSYFSFINWSVNLITYIVWLKFRKETEKYNSPLIKGRIGAYATLLFIAVLFILSLRVIDFRMGFYAAAVMLIMIMIPYKFSAAQK